MNTLDSMAMWVKIVTFCLIFHIFNSVRIFQTYDGIWAAALAIQYVAKRKDQLSHFEYRRKDWESIFLEALKNTSFEGVTVSVVLKHEMHSTSTLYLFLSAGPRSFLQQREKSQHTVEAVSNRPRSQDRRIQFNREQTDLRLWRELALARQWPAKGSDFAHHRAKPSQFDHLRYSGLLLDTRDRPGDCVPRIQHQISKSKIHKNVKSALEQPDHCRLHAHLSQRSIPRLGQRIE